MKFKLELSFANKQSVELYKTFNTTRAGQGWGCAERWRQRICRDYKAEGEITGWNLILQKDEK